MADGIDVERGALQAELVEEGHQHCDDFGIDSGSVGAAETLCANLVELAVAAFLRTFAAEHRAHVVELHGLGQGLHPVLEIRAADAGSGLGTQSHLGTPLHISEGRLCLIRLAGIFRGR